MCGVSYSSVKFEEVFLNSALLSRPKFVNDPTGVLLHFLKYAVGIMSDIEQMFYSFQQQKIDHRDFLRFFMVSQQRSKRGTYRVPYEGPCFWKHTISSCSYAWFTENNAKHRQRCEKLCLQKRSHQDILFQDWNCEVLIQSQN